MKKSVPFLLVVSMLVVMSQLIGCGSSSNYKDSYQFALNGCDTGTHEFTGDNADDVKKQVCNALKDATLNKGCAEDQRHQAFQSKCSGYTWDDGAHASSPSASASTAPAAMPEIRLVPPISLPSVPGAPVYQNHDSYQFSFNGCDTGKHEFFGDNAEAVKKQLCDSLKDSILNKGCAENLRREFFRLKCSGSTWSPTSVSDESSFAPEENKNCSKMEKRIIPFLADKTMTCEAAKETMKYIGCGTNFPFKGCP